MRFLIRLNKIFSYIFPIQNVKYITLIICLLLSCLGIVNIASAYVNVPLTLLGNPELRGWGSTTVPSDSLHLDEKGELHIFPLGQTALSYNLNLPYIGFKPPQEKVRVDLTKNIVSIITPHTSTLYIRIQNRNLTAENSMMYNVFKFERPINRSFTFNFPEDETDFTSFALFLMLNTG